MSLQWQVLTSVQQQLRSWSRAFRKAQPDLQFSSAFKNTESFTVNDCETDREGLQIKAAGLTVTYTYMSKSSCVIWLWEQDVYHITFPTTPSLFFVLGGKQSLTFVESSKYSIIFVINVAFTGRSTEQKWKSSLTEPSILRLNWT